MAGEPKYKSIDLGGLVLFHSEHATATLAYDHWKDVEGERYHFPNQYREKMEFAQGKPFVYYRGVRRADGSRGEPEYFGTGTIGEIYRDEEIPETAPKKEWAWYCDLLDYVPFPTPVPAISGGAPLFEDISRNEWGVGIRPLSRLQIDKLLRAAGLPPDGPAPEPTPIDRAKLLEAGSLAEVLRPTRNARGGSGDGSRSRRSRFSKAVGDRAEELVFRDLEAAERAGRIRDLRWLARDRETPGWDIEYRDGGGELIRVEVKGTTSPAFASFEMTAQEWAQAAALGANYQVHLVASCMSERPRRVVITPAELHASGMLDATPATWILRFRGD